MISKDKLKQIAFNKIEASKTLFEAEKFDNSVYLIGYAIELSLKFKICNIFKLDEGFPETKAEFENYILKSDIELGSEINNLKEIKNHNLQKILFYSGEEYKIKTELIDEWATISIWKPEMRYDLDFIDKIENSKILISAEKILNSIFKYYNHG